MNFLVILTISIGILHLSQGMAFGPRKHEPRNYCYLLSSNETKGMKYEHGELHSYSYWERDTKTLNDAAKICMIEIEGANAECEESLSYGIGDEKHDPRMAPTTIWAELGCEAQFKIHYLPGKCEHVHLGSVLTCPDGSDVCPEQEVSATMPGDILGMYIQNGDEGESECIEGINLNDENEKQWTYGWTDKKAVVRNGCSSDWFICHNNEIMK